ncbi:hypothetical protein ACFWAY_26185 [Rhodococcus sp. NPDC059968]|uniref:hypothetical protein n=1 Tax=Rhodococcus sp. NPDC059968 TaxID=3347017 RepID=UPI00366F60D7
MTKNLGLIDPTNAVPLAGHRGLGTASAGGPLGKPAAAKSKTAWFAALGAAAVLLVGAGIDAATTPSAEGAATPAATSIAAPGVNTPGDDNDSRDRHERRERREQQRADTLPDAVILGQMVAAGIADTPFQATPAWGLERPTIGEGLQTDTLG